MSCVDYLKNFNQVCLKIMKKNSLMYVYNLNEFKQKI